MHRRRTPAKPQRGRTPETGRTVVHEASVCENTRRAPGCGGNEGVEPDMTTRQEIAALRLAQQRYFAEAAAAQFLMAALVGRLRDNGMLSQADVDVIRDLAQRMAATVSQSNVPEMAAQGAAVQRALTRMLGELPDRTGT